MTGQGWAASVCSHHAGQLRCPDAPHSCQVSSSSRGVSTISLRVRSLSLPHSSGGVRLTSKVERAGRNTVSRPHALATQEAELADIPIPQYSVKPLPYPSDSLEPVLSKKAVELHWGEHYQAHVKALNERLREEPELAKLPLEELVKKAYRHGNPLMLFNDAAEVYNHECFFDSMVPGGRSELSPDLLELIERDFGSVDGLKKEFQQKAEAHVGGGWTWLVVRPEDTVPEIYRRPGYHLFEQYANSVNHIVGRLRIETTPNAFNPLVYDHHPLLALDVWEHAYYLDYQNDRSAYVHNFLENVVDWQMVTRRLRRSNTFVALTEEEHPEFAKDTRNVGEVEQAYFESYEKAVTESQKKQKMGEDDDIGDDN